MYKQQIDCTEEELCEEFKNLWPLFNRFWPEYQHETRTSQQRFLGHILSIYNITHVGISKLLRILISVAPSTGSLERSFSKLSNICYKERIQLTTKHLKHCTYCASLKEVKWIVTEPLKSWKTIA